MRDGGGVTAVLDRADRLLWWLGAHRRAAVGGLLALAVVVVAAVLLVGRGAGAPALRSHINIRRRRRIALCIYRWSAEN
jgi:hypothetical protein